MRIILGVSRIAQFAMRHSWSFCEEILEKTEGFYHRNLLRRLRPVYHQPGGAGWAAMLVRHPGHHHGADKGTDPHPDEYGADCVGAARYPFILEKI